MENARRLPYAIPLLALLAAGCGIPDVFYLWDDVPGGEVGDTLLDCAATCAPLAPAGWARDPVLLWTGNELAAPPCPGSAPDLQQTGYEDLLSQGVCDVCTCSEPACVLPAGLTASSSTCSADGPDSVHTAIKTPAEWDGGCVSLAVIPYSAAKSMEIAESTVSACTPGTSPVAAKVASPTWGKHVLTCQGTSFGRCDSQSSICAPTPDAQFRLCVERTSLYAQPETDACPEDYPERHMIYSNFEDQRSCTPCACDAPTGTECLALVSTYAGADCTSLIGANALSTDGPYCMTNGLGKGLASMSASWVNNTPGMCKPTGGDLTGEIVLTQPILFCCQP